MGYLPNETFSKYIFFADKNNKPMDPDTKTATVYKPDGSTASATLSVVETGKYELNYNIPADAGEGSEWKILIYAVKGTYSRKFPILFSIDKF